MKVSFKKIKKGEKFSKPSLFMGSDGKIRSNIIMGEGTAASEDGWCVPFEDLELLPKEGGSDPSLLARSLAWIRSHFSINGMRLDGEYKEYLVRKGFCVEP